MFCCKTTIHDSFRDNWRKRTCYTDWFVQWLNAFVAYNQRPEGVSSESLHYISENEKAKVLH